MRRSLAALSPEERDKRSRKIETQLQGSLVAAKSVALYASLPDEVPTERWLRERWERGAPVYLPRMRADKTLDFVQVESEADLVVTPYGFREPHASLRAEPAHTLELAVVPALALDRRGVRLGRGGGYYDRSFGLLSQRPRLVGVVFDFQVLEVLPRAAHDLRVDAVVTEHGTQVPR